MGLIETSTALAISVAVLAVLIVLDRRPYRPGKRNLVMPMIVALAASLLLARHLLALVF